MNEMQTLARNQAAPPLVSAKMILTALAFGAAGWLVMAAGLKIPVIGTEIITDPRELFATIGAALTGPVGGILIAFMVGSPDFTNMFSITGHVVGGLWMGFAYKKLVYQRLRMPMLLVGWAGSVLVYYYLAVIPGALGYIAVKNLLFPSSFEHLFKETALGQAYVSLAEAAIPEAILITLVTTVVIAALPPKFRRPLW